MERVDRLRELRNYGFSRSLVSSRPRHFDHAVCLDQVIQSGSALPDVRVVTLQLRTPESGIKVAGMT
jgi:hypothetical protein